jgi:hypothetical protein
MLDISLILCKRSHSFMNASAKIKSRKINLFSPFQISVLTLHLGCITRVTESRGRMFGTRALYIEEPSFKPGGRIF